jgi:hypothetical protein
MISVEQRLVQMYYGIHRMVSTSDFLEKYPVCNIPQAPTLRKKYLSECHHSDLGEIWANLQDAVTWNKLDETRHL